MRESSTQVPLPPISDPVLTSLAQDVFKVISQTSSEALAPLQTRLVPTLVSIMDSQAEKVTPGLQAVALGMSLKIQFILHSVTQNTGYSMMSMLPK